MTTPSDTDTANDRSLTALIQARAETAVTRRPLRWLRWWHPLVTWTGKASLHALRMIPGHWDHEVTLAAFALIGAQIAVVNVRVRADSRAGRPATLTLVPSSGCSPEIVERVDALDAYMETLFALFDDACDEAGVELPARRTPLTVHDGGQRQVRRPGDRILPGRPPWHVTGSAG